MHARHVRLLSALAIALLAAAGAAFARSDAPLRHWVALPELSADALARLAARHDVRGEVAGRTLAVVADDAIAAFVELHPGATVLARHRPDERLFALPVEPGLRIGTAPGVRVLLRDGQLALLGVAAGREHLLREVVPPPRRAHLHDGVVPVPTRPMRVPAPAPARFLHDGVVSTPDYDDRIQGWVDQVNRSHLETDVTALSTSFTTRYSRSEEGVAAQSWLVDRFTALGLATTLHDFDAHADNVVAELPGLLEPEKVVVVGAHYDSFAFFSGVAPGADDNASGTSALLGIARILSESGAELRYTVRFVAFASEELGLIGSDAYSGMLRSQGVDVVGMLNTDMNAYRAAGDALDLDMVTTSATDWLTDLVLAVAAQYVPELPTRTGGLLFGSSNHASFFNDGFPAVFFFEDTGDSSPYIHTADDVVGTSANDFELSELIVKAVLASAAVLADPVDVEPAPTLAVTGSCPGAVTVDVAGASPNASIALARAGGAGRFFLPSGSCVGAVVDLAGPVLAAVLTADASGAAHLERSLPATACGLLVQGVDLADCQSTNVATVP